MTCKDYGGGILTLLHVGNPEDQGDPPDFYVFPPISFPVYLNIGFVNRLQEQKHLFLLQGGRRDSH
jgi:hypothetical protein